MNALKQLASQTAIYGLSSIVGRILNYFLTPLLTFVFLPEEYGVNAEIYAYVSFFIVILTYGMETGFFRFSNSQEETKKVYQTALISLAATSSIFILLGLFFSGGLASVVGYPDRPDFIIYVVLILGIDAFCSIPLASLRKANEAKRFAIINLVSIGVNIFFVVFFVWFGKYYHDTSTWCWLSDTIYSPSIGIGYVFIANLLASISKLVLLRKEIRFDFAFFDADLLKKLLLYSSPLLLAGIAGIINETLDRILLKRILASMYDTTYALTQVGIYGGVYKLSILITLFIQAFRYAAEPFFFSKQNDKDANLTYSMVMTYFVITVSSIFLGIVLFIDVFKWFIPNQEYWVGLTVVPILLIANIFLGVYFNQSIWYKLSGKTKYGAYIAGVGAIITILLNVIFIPYFGFVASAWTTLIAYGTMMAVSYYLGQKHYPIKYNVKKVSFYFFSALGLFFVSKGIDLLISDSLFIKLFIHAILFLVYVWFIYIIEKPQLKALFKRT